MRTPIDDMDAQLDAEAGPPAARRRAAAAADASPASPRGDDWAFYTTAELRHKLDQVQRSVRSVASGRLPDGGAKLRVREHALQAELAARATADARRAADAAALAAAARAAAAAQQRKGKGKAAPSREPTPPDAAASKHWLSSATAEAAATRPRGREAACCLCERPAAALGHLPAGRVPADTVAALARGAGVRAADLRVCRDCARDNFGAPPPRQARLDGLTGWGLGQGGRRGGSGTAPPPPPDDAPLIVLDDDDGAPSPPAAAAAARGTHFTASGKRRSGRAGAGAGARGGAAARYKGLAAAWPRGGHRGAVAFGPADVACLDDDAMLNDTIIDLQIKRIQDALPADRRPRFHFFSSFFYKKLIQGAGRAAAAAAPGAAGGAPRPRAANHAAVASWTRAVDVFAADYLVVPVHDDLHWSLVVVAYPGSVAGSPHVDGDAARAAAAAGVYPSPRAPPPAVLHLDSMGAHASCGHKAGTVARVVRSYLEQEWAARAAAARGRGVDWAPAFAPRAMPTINPPSLPLQDNAVDCGLLVLAYADYFCAGAPLPARAGDPPAATTAATVTLPPISRDSVSSMWRLPGSPWPGFLHETWFPPGAEARGLRRDLRAFMLAEMVEQSMEKGSVDAAALAAATADAADAAGGAAGVHYTRPADAVARARGRVDAAIAKAEARAGTRSGTRSFFARRSSDGFGSGDGGADRRSTLAAAAEGRRAPPPAMDLSLSGGFVRERAVPPPQPEVRTFARNKRHKFF